MWSIFLLSAVCGFLGFWLAYAFIKFGCEDFFPKPEFCAAVVGSFLGLSAAFIPVAFVWSRFWLVPISLPTVLALILLISSIFFYVRYKTVLFNIPLLKERHNLRGLVAALRYGSCNPRYEAARALAEIGDESVVPALITTLLKDHYLSVRSQAATALGVIKSSRSIDALTTAL